MEVPTWRVGLMAVLTRAVTIALATATLQAAWQLGKATIFGRIVFASRELPWMAAASYQLFFALVALPLLIGALVLPRLPWPAITTAMCGAAGAFALLTSVSWIATWAKLLLAIGVGMQLVRMVEGARVAHTGRLIAAASLAFIALSSAALHADSELHERRRVASLPAASAGAPNVLLIVLDAVRAANLSA